MTRLSAVVFTLALGLMSAVALASEGGIFGSAPTAGLKIPTMVADASEAAPDAQPLAEETKADNYEVCAAYRADIDADLGDLLRAGCEPTLAQMSALMDNPIGNVAMMFNQYDAYNIEEPESGTDEFQHNYMMLFQFPKKLNNDWNLINRVILNYTVCRWTRTTSTTSNRPPALKTLTTRHYPA